MATTKVKGVPLNYTLVTKEDVELAFDQLHTDELLLLKKHYKSFSLHIGNGEMRTDKRCGEMWVRDRKINVRLYIHNSRIDPGTVVHEVTHVVQWLRGENMDQDLSLSVGGSACYFSHRLEKEAFRNEYLWKKKIGMVRLPYRLWYAITLLEFKVRDFIGRI